MDAARASAPLRAADVAGLCGRCHERPTGLAVGTGGHAAELGCEDCHRDRRPGRFGRRHRSKVSCTSHHDAHGHPGRARSQGAGGKQRQIRRCISCHEPHGAQNLALVREEIRSRRARLVPVRFDSTAGAAPGGFTDPMDPGSGLCEICHRRTAYYGRSGGQEHFTESCTLCHAHTAGFDAVADEQNCAICHPQEAARLAKPSQHGERFLCGDCHEEISPAPGPAHRTILDCADCHTTQTHAPTGAAPLPCVQCHDAHGTDNIKLVLEEVMTTSGALRTIQFDNLLGKQDGSFASASMPGTGICEVCHTTTQFYRGDGSGAAHATFSCKPCHLHSSGFAPQ